MTLSESSRFGILGVLVRPGPWILLRHHRNHWNHRPGDFGPLIYLLTTMMTRCMAMATNRRTKQGSFVTLRSTSFLGVTRSLPHSHDQLQSIFPFNCHPYGASVRAFTLLEQEETRRRPALCTCQCPPCLDKADKINDDSPHHVWAKIIQSCSKIPFMLSISFLCVLTPSSQQGRRFSIY